MPSSGVQDRAPARFYNSLVGAEAQDWLNRLSACSEYNLLDASASADHRLLKRLKRALAKSLHLTPSPAKLPCPQLLIVSVMPGNE